MIKVKNIQKRFKNQQVLKSVNLNIENGKVQALLGANGAGKSTLIYIISGLLEKDAGEVWIDGEKIEMESYSYRHKVGYVFDKPMYLQKFSAKEHLNFVGEMYGIPKEEYRSRVDELLAFFELPTDNKKRIEEYSKGMKNKVSLASALLHQPKYLIVDEPFDGLDFLSVQKSCSLLRKLAEKGTTILITSHQFDVIADVCDNIALLKEGEIIFNKDINELQQESTAYGTDKNALKQHMENLMASGAEKSELSWVK